MSSGLARAKSAVAAGLVLAALSCSGVASTPPAVTEPPAPAADARREPDTPSKVPTAERGRCFIMDPRTSGTSLSWDDSWCDAPPRLGNLYSWLPDLLGAALDGAETATCGARGCALGSRHVRIYLVAKDVPSLTVSRSSSKVVAVMTTALVDLVEGAVVAYLDELNAAKTGGLPVFHHFLSLMRAMGGTRCGPLRSPIHPLDDQAYFNVRNAAQVFYQFAFMHELAHILKGDSCGESVQTDLLTREAACDRFAFHTLAPKRGVLPLLLVAPMLLIASYQSLFAERVRAAALEDPVLSMGEGFEAAQWLKRAEVVINEWDAFCRVNPPDPVVCLGNNMAALLDHAGQLLTASLPSPCLTSPGAVAPSPPPAIVPDAAAAACLKRVGVDDDDIGWDKNGRPPVVRLRLSYRNTCDRSVHCGLTVACGTALRQASPTLGKDWKPFSSATDIFTLKPGFARDVVLTLRWISDEQRMPSLRFPDNLGRDADLVACAFTGDPTPPNFCGVLQEIIDASRRNFDSLKGNPVVLKGETFSWISKQSLPGSLDCEVHDGENRPWVACGMAFTHDAAEADRKYDELLDKLRRCMPAPAWSATAETPTGPTTTVRAVRFEPTNGGSSVLIRRSANARATVPHSVWLTVSGPAKP